MTIQSPPAVELAGLTKTFGSGEDAVHAVRGLQLTIPQGEIVAFLGPNGAGKTTTLDIVLGLNDPTGGSARVFGIDPHHAIRTGRVGAVLQTGGLLRDLTVRETVQVIASTYERPLPIDTIIAQAGIEDIAGRKVSKCSGGEQQRLRFALAIISDPDLLILDEPTAAMDVRARRDFWDTMQADATNGRTVIFATHYLEEADAFAERIVMVARGKIVADGPTEQIRAQATGRTVSADLPEDRVSDVVTLLKGLPDVREVSERGGRVTITAGDSDAVALTLLRDLGGRNLEVVTGSLESAFMAITDVEDDSEPVELVGAGR